MNFFLKHAYSNTQMLKYKYTNIEIKKNKQTNKQTFIFTNFQYTKCQELLLQETCLC